MAQHPALIQLARMLAEQAVKNHFAQQTKAQSDSQPIRSNHPVQSASPSR